LLLTIEKLIYGGDGLARLLVDSTEDDRARGKAVFVPFTLAGEKVEAAITEEKPGFARARAEKIVEPSPHRIEPQCPYFSHCGGCHYQHTTYEHQLEIKQEILRENLRRIAKLEVGKIEVHSSPPWNYRNRSRFQVRTQPEFAAGYFKHNSHEMQLVEECPISSPLINRALAELWKLGRANKVPESIREIEFFANNANDNGNDNDAQLLVEISCGSSARRAAIKDFAEEFRAAFPPIIGVTAARDSAQNAHSSRKSSRSNAPIPQENLLTLGEPHLTYRAAGHDYRVSAGSFFQTNRYLIDKLVDIVTVDRSGELALDLYAGVGLFSTALACDIRHTISVESSQTAVRDLTYNLKLKGEAIQAATEQFLERGSNGSKQRAVAGAGKALPHIARKPDLAIVDPPRSGLGDRTARALVVLGAPRITYVSCDPATLARDLVILLGGGYRVEQIHLIDLFPQTYHLESVLQLVR
jgi:23S rRNA (uracil1939-C5)-methyltransferase